MEPMGALYTPKIFRISLKKELLWSLWVDP